MSDWLAWLRDLAGQQPTAMISVLASEGSAPRGAGTRMVVTAQIERGTIGGGQLEFRAVEQARAILAHSPGAWRVQDYPLGPMLGQCCGGRVRLLVEHVDPARLDWLPKAARDHWLVTTLHAGRVERELAAEAAIAPLSVRGERPGEGARFAEPVGPGLRPLYLFGAGHVGQAIARHGRGLPFRLAWFDPRPGFGSIEGVTTVAESAITSCVDVAPADSAILILTHDHALDYRLVKAALERPPVAFVGLIGSATKRARFLARLAREGVSAPARARMTCPIGIAGIPGKEPDVIAVAALAQLLQLPQVLEPSQVLQPSQAQQWPQVRQPPPALQSQPA